MRFRKPQSSYFCGSALSQTDIDALEDIRGDLKFSHEGCSPGDREIIDIALRRMQYDLNVRCSQEVIEDVKREIMYRQWCAQNPQGESVRSGTFRALLHRRGTI
jgi:hypothetical protein